MVTISGHPDTPGVGPYETDIGTDLLHLISGPATVFLDDLNLRSMPRTTIDVGNSQPGEQRGPEAIFYGHYFAGSYGSGSASEFDGGDWSNLTLDLQGFLAGSKFTVLSQPQFDASILTIENASGQTLRTIELVGGAPSASELHIRFT
jgi:hypothetical protein